MTPRSATLTPLRWPIALGAWLLLSLLCVAWAFVTPISGSPDEPAHIVKAAAVVRGELTGSVGRGGSTEVQVPSYIAYSHAAPCFAFKTNESAACMPKPPTNGDSTVTSPTLAGLYNPTYYAIVGWPSLLFQDVGGIYAMRIVSGVVSSLFFALALLMICTWKRPTVPILTMAIAVPPMLLFLGGAVNPNAFEAATITAVFVAVLSILRYPSTSFFKSRLAILAVAAALGVNARGLSPLWFAVAVLAPFILTRREDLYAVLRRPAIWIVVGISFIASMFAVAWILATNSLGSGASSGALQNTFPGAGSSAIAGFVHTIESTFGSAQDMIGDFGWLDTLAPLGVFYAWAGFVAALLFAAVLTLRRRELLFVGVLVAALVLIPALVQGVYIHSGGIIWQGRYALPLFAVLLLGTAAVLGEHTPYLPRLTTRLTPLLLVIWVVCQWLSFGTVLRRYAVGSTGTIGELLRSPGWVSPGGNLTWLALFAVFLLAAATGLWRVVARSNRAASEQAVALSAPPVVQP